MEDDALRRQLVQLLDGVGAHMTFEEAIADFPGEAMNLRAPNVDYTPWHLVEHLRLTQADILEYVVNEDYVENVGEFAILRQVMGTWRQAISRLDHDVRYVHHEAYPDLP